MREIRVNLKDNGYPILVGADILSLLPEKLSRLPVNRQLAIISTPPVSALYLKKVNRLFGREWKVLNIDVPDGEASKSLKEINHVFTLLIKNHFERQSTIIALGGGVVGDMAGFVAASYLRGVNLIQLPTTLLAQVDSSIGGKVGINHSLGKNLIGAFHQPKMVLADVRFFKTLPPEEFICGMGEVVKYGILGSRPLFETLEKNLDQILGKNNDLLSDIVYDCAQIKARIVEEDEREQGIRAHLNLGHTFGHALETFYKSVSLKHGQAVLLGMRCAVWCAGQLNLLDEESARRIDQLILRTGVKLPAKMRMDPGKLLAIMKRDKKVRDGRINLVLPERIGRVTVQSVSDEGLLKDSFSHLQA